uniref:Putative ovule protein n=1 Tax=Solanum chacoense TaxID=4108 RepID=A0A0V0GNI6_SOLCH
MDTLIACNESVLLAIKSNPKSSALALLHRDNMQNIQLGLSSCRTSFLGFNFHQYAHLDFPLLICGCIN